MIPEHLANRDLDPSILAPVAEPPARARVVVIGGGIIGSSIAYHLTRLGVRDVAVLERTRLTGGTTWHAAGLVSQLRGTHALTALARLNAPTYARLGAETGVETGFRQVGSLSVARTPARMQEYLAGTDLAAAEGVPYEVLTSHEIMNHWPTAEVDDLVGGVLYPQDGTVNPGDAALALAKGAADGGATFAFGVTVTGFLEAGGRITGVRTDRGDVEADAVVIASGLWSSEVARLAGVSVSLYPAEHVWVMTEPDPEARESSPFLRDLDGYLYIRHYRGGYLVGAFEPRGKPKAPADIDTTGFVEFGEDWDHFAPVLENARERLPVLREIGFRHYLRAPESFTPDANLHLGPFPERPGLWIAAGLNSQGVIYAPGVGTALAEWIVEDRPTYDLTELDVSRIGGWANDRAWLHAKTAETLGRLYAMHWPGLRSEVARGVRWTPLADPLRAEGAAFGEAGGWERPAWYEPGATREPAWGYDFERPSWFGPVAEEVRACREAAAFFDLSTYAKFLVEGPEALAGLQRLCASNVDVPVGRVVYTVLCNERGGIEMDPTVTRLGEDRFLVLAPTVWHRRTLALLRAGLPAGAHVGDVTNAYAALHVAGPASRDVLTGIVEADLGDDAFPFLTMQEVAAGWTRAWALRVSFTGELGWELYVPVEFARSLHGSIADAGRDAGLRHAGAFAFDTLRVERGFRSWGHDIGAVDDPYASGLGFAVGRGKEAPFVGRDALEALRDAPRERRLASVLLDDASSMLWHGEPVWADGRAIGHVTSGAYGSTLGAPVGLAWIHGEVPERAEVAVRGRRIDATISEEPFYDPKGAQAR